MPVKMNSRSDPRPEEEQLWAKFCERQTFLRKHYGGLFKRVDADWHEAASRKNFLELEEVSKLPEYLSESNYAATMRTLLKMDEAHCAIEMRRYDLIGHKLEIKSSISRKGSIKYFRVEGLADGQPQLIIRDWVIMRNKSGRSVKFNIEAIEDDWIWIPQEHAENEKFLTGELDLYFVSSGLLYEYYERALKRFERNPETKYRIFNCLQPEPPIFKPINSAPKAEERLKKLDRHQRQAVDMILNAKHYPKPYIVYGPPGTGKSHTLAEAIVQIYARKPDCRILACANSNTCADQMFSKLKAIDIIPEKDVVRLSAGDEDSTIGISRIVVTTNMKSASLIWKHYFHYVIVDEAGHSHEPETLVPISCLDRYGCLVLAGDPKQLGPVAHCGETKCNELRKYGLDRSMLERFLKLKFYKRDITSGNFNCKYITQLPISYRCDPRVLSISNELFYNRKLRCVNETPKWLLDKMGITNPLQLKIVRGQERQPKASTSWCNDMEADECVNLVLLLYKMGIKPDQVGVMSPYKLQAKRIDEKLYDKLKTLGLSRKFQLTEKERGGTHPNIPELDHSGCDAVQSNMHRPSGNSLIKIVSCEPVGKEIEKKWLCKIDSVDAYQGDERDIIIISTVRTTSERDKKFIDEWRRFNVAMSRARWLVIVIGDKEVLSGLKRWKQFPQRSSEEIRNQSKQLASREAFKRKISKLKSKNADLHRNRQ